MSLKITVEGWDKVVANLNALGPGSTQALAAALYQEGEALIAESKAVYVPVDTGALRASGHVLQPEIKGTQVTVRCGFGGIAATYAVYVHENLEAQHKPPTQAKYLETPARRRASTLAARVAEKLAIKK